MNYLSVEYTKDLHRVEVGLGAFEPAKIETWLHMFFLQQTKVLVCYACVDDEEWIPVGGARYLISKDEKTFQDARKYCEDRKSTLARFPMREDEKKIGEIFQRKRPGQKVFWEDLNDIKKGIYPED